MVGQTISHFKILAELGRGGMGVVYKAEDIQLHCFRALKFLSIETLATEAERARFVAEARALAAIEHANICPVHEIGEADGKTFIAMSFLEGETLEQKIARGPLEVAEVISYAKQVATGLQKAHGEGVIHRDIKPANVMITEEDLAVIMDFGLAKQEDATRLTRTGSTLGTAAYMSPEQVAGAGTDARTDLWSLGVMMYEMLAGRRPFQADNELSLMYAISKEHPEPISRQRTGVPAAVEEIVERLLEKDPQSRFADAGKLLSALEALEESVATGTVTRFRLQRWQRRRLGRILAVAVPVVALLAVALFLWPGLLKPERAVSSLAVMPLVERAAGEDQAYFAEGITDELITGLMKMGRDLTVVSRTSALRAREQYETLSEIASHLGVDAVVEGTVQREGERIRVSAQLVLASTSELLWADSYERNLRDVFSLQSELARAVVTAIEAELTPAGLAEPAAAKPVDPAAYELVLRGRFHRNKYTPEGLRKSLESNQAAVRIDPKYAVAYAEMAGTYLILGMGWGGADFDVQHCQELAHAYIDSAFVLDPDLALAHASAAIDAMYLKWDWEAARRGFERAIELDPGCTPAWEERAFFYSIVGDYDRAVASAQRAKQLDPLAPMTVTDLGVMYWDAGQNQKALVEYEAALDLDPDFAAAKIMMGQLYIDTGRYEDAIEILASIDDLHWLGIAHAAAGNHAEAEAILERALAGEDEGLSDPVTLAMLHLALGQTDKALDLLTELYEARFPWLPFYLVSPQLDSVRGDPRFQAIVRGIGLPTS